MDPKVVSTAEWLEARRELVEQEAEWGKARERLIAARRALPMVEVTKDYQFEGPNGKASLLDLFEGRRQLIVYHFMYAPEWEQGCKHCSFIVDHIGPVVHANAKGTTFALASRAPYSQIAEFKKRMGWSVPWYSVDGPSFNYDFHVTLEDAYDPDSAPAEPDETRFQEGAAGVFVREGDRIFHSYSTYSGIEIDLLHNTFNLLDLTPLGREDDAPGRPWLHHHDRYPAEAAAVGAS